ncbi:MAG TPA: NAD(P)/FAD-dependent oxidoreductase [Mycobacteriales bacterium]|nr:NAD(P)/FAD-dependent oxidoreductase [Mycobacteriales bacterium]
MSEQAADAVVIGAGPNGLVAANLLADAGWDVVVLEAQPEPGGAVRTSRWPSPDYLADDCSAFYPLAAASPAITGLHLEDHGLHWLRTPAVLAHPLLDGRCATLHSDLECTVAELDEFGAGDGAAWRRLYELWERVGDELVGALFTPFPPVRAAARIARRLGPAGLLRFARFALLPVRRLAEEEFAGPGALLLAGCALHTDLMPESAGSATFGWLLAMLAQQVGFPVPEGGAAQLTAAMVRRLEARGGQVRCNSRVQQVVVRRGRATGVRTTDGTEVRAHYAVLADVDAPQLYADLVGWDHLPPRLRDDMRRFHWDFATFKVDFALRGKMPWSAEVASAAGTVHLAADLDEMTDYTAQLATGRIPARPFLLVGQMTTADPSRSPVGTESLWAYTHVPREVRGDAGGDLSGDWNADAERFADRIEEQLERFAPGMREQISDRRISTPLGLQAHDANLVGGAINGGTTAIHQQLVFRPVPGLGRPETPIAGLYLASASAHPGGAVHGACGANAARAALVGRRMRSARATSWLTRKAIGE